MNIPMIPNSLDRIAAALERTGQDWHLRTNEREPYLRQVAQRIDEFLQEHERLFGSDGPPDPFDLVESNIDKATAFFQTLAGRPFSVQMRVMIWEVILGAEIKALDFQYRLQGVTALQVVLSTPHRSVSEQIFTTESLWDFRIFRHIGLLSVNSQPILDGYYATRI